MGPMQPEPMPAPLEAPAVVDPTPAPLEAPAVVDPTPAPLEPQPTADPPPIYAADTAPATPDVPAATPADETTSEPAAPATGTALAVGSLVSASLAIAGREYAETRYGIVVDVDDAGHASVAWLEAVSVLPVDALGAV